MPSFPSSISTTYTDVLGDAATKATILGKQGLASGAAQFSAGSDNIVIYDGPNFVFMGPGDDTVVSGAVGDDALAGNEGSDSLVGGFGNDLLGGGPGADTLSGGEDNDEIRGGQGNDVLRGESGADTLYGGLGDDTLIGGDGEKYDRYMFLGTNGGRDVITEFDMTGDRMVVPAGTTYTLGTSVAGYTQVTLSTGQVIELQKHTGFMVEWFTFV